MSDKRVSEMTTGEYGNLPYLYYVAFAHRGGFGHAEIRARIPMTSMAGISGVASYIRDKGTVDPVLLNWILLSGPAEDRAEALESFARRLVAFDDPDPASPGFQERRRTNMNQIIGWAREALGEEEE